MDWTPPPPLLTTARRTSSVTEAISTKRPSYRPSLRGTLLTHPHLATTCRSSRRQPAAREGDHATMTSWPPVILSPRPSSGLATAYEGPMVTPRDASSASGGASLPGRRQRSSSGTPRWQAPLRHALGMKYPVLASMPENIPEVATICNVSDLGPTGHLPTTDARLVRHCYAVAPSAALPAALGSPPPPPAPLGPRLVF